ncbi:hypothetical protein [Pseudomonas bubulae]|mgnify:CR=1 FL=1|uniref:hypothetical protein n=1 Tax=Pseudomonas bubulae TaxID=2316085 RepID=UPI0039A2413F
MSLLKTTGWVISLALMAGCDGAPQIFANREPHGVMLPALPIIQRAVMGMVPMVEGQRNDVMMHHVCAMARGESTAHQVAETLKKQGVDLSITPAKGDPLSLLVDPDMSHRATACAAYVATSPMVLPRTSDFMVETVNEQTRERHPRTMHIDPQKLNTYLRVQLAIAKSDADVFALIASQLAQTPGLTLDQYNQRAKSLFTIIAPGYLQRVKELYTNAKNDQYTLKEYSDTGFKFTSSSGHSFEYDYNGLNLSYNHIPWYGAGQLLGKTYWLDVAYFDPALVATLKTLPGTTTAVKP